MCEINGNPWGDVPHHPSVQGPVPAQSAGGFLDAAEAFQHLQNLEDVSLDHNLAWSFMAPTAIVEEVVSATGDQPTPPGHLRFVCISDTHGLHRDIQSVIGSSGCCLMTSVGSVWGCASPHWRLY